MKGMPQEPAYLTFKIKIPCEANAQLLNFHPPVSSALEVKRVRKCRQTSLMRSLDATAQFHTSTNKKSARLRGKERQVHQNGPPT